MSFSFISERKSLAPSFFLVPPIKSKALHTLSSLYSICLINVSFLYYCYYFIVIIMVFYLFLYKFCFVKESVMKGGIFDSSLWSGQVPVYLLHPL